MVAIDAIALKAADDAETIPFNNKVDLRQACDFYQFGGKSGVIEGWGYSVVAGQQQLTVAQGAGMVAARNASQVEQRWGHLAQTRSTVTVQFNAAGGANRRDALVFAVADPTAPGTFPGTLGLAAGGHLVSVPGVSPTVDLTDAQIQAAVGPGGFHRMANVLIPTGSTQISAGNIDYTAYKINTYNHFGDIPGFAGLTAASNWVIHIAQYKLNLIESRVSVRIMVGRTSVDTPSPSAGADITDVDITTNWPSLLLPTQTDYDAWLFADRGSTGDGQQSGVATHRCRVAVDTPRLKLTNMLTPIVWPANSLGVIHGSYELT